MRNKVIAATLALSAWVAGTAFGSIGAVPSATAFPLLSVGRAHSDYAPVLDGSKPIFIFFLGADARPGTPVDHGLCDSIHILRLQPCRGRATLLGIPRDSYVPLGNGWRGQDQLRDAPRRPRGRDPNRSRTSPASPPTTSRSPDSADWLMRSTRSAG